MITRYISKRKIISLIKKLAIYNDKGRFWSKHSDQKIEYERSQLIRQIKLCLIKFEGSPNYDILTRAIEDGSLKTDMQGQFIDIANRFNIRDK